MTVLITLSIAGTDSGPYNLYSSPNGTTFTLFAMGITKSALLAGYTSYVVPDGSTTIRVMSTGTCTNYIDLTIPNSGTTTTSSTTAVPTTTTTTTAVGPTTTTTTTISPNLIALKMSTDQFNLCNTSFQNYYTAGGTLVQGTQIFTNAALTIAYSGGATYVTSGFSIFNLSGNTVGTLTGINCP